MAVGMTMLDLFSGIGGFSLAASWLGIETVAFVERDAFCQKVLKKHWPDIPIYSDIFDIKGDEFGSVDLITGGFPCQPFSCAGTRKGSSDDRHLWPEMLRLIKHIKPEYILAENVPGLLTIEHGEVFADIITSLEDEDYEVQVCIVPASAVGAPHRRDRVWIACHAVSNTDRSSHGGEIGERIGRREVKDSSQRDKVGNNIADTDCHVAISAGDGLHTSEQGELRGHKYETSARQEDATETGRPGLLVRRQYAPDTSSERLQGRIETMRGQRSQSDDKLTNGRGGEWSENWYSVALRTCVRTLDDGLPRGLPRPKGWRVNALKAVGNSIVPQVAYEILKSMFAGRLVMGGER